MTSHRTSIEIAHFGHRDVLFVSEGIVNMELTKNGFGLAWSASS